MSAHSGRGSKSSEAAVHIEPDGPPISDSVADETSDASQVQEQARRPDWSIWRGRHSATVREAVCLALNVFPSKAACADLKQRKDTRVRRLNAHIRTATRWLGQSGGIVEVGPQKRPKSATEIGLPEFIAWLEKKHLDGVDPPVELLTLNPPNPRALSTERGTPKGQAPTGSPVYAAEAHQKPGVRLADQVLPGLLVRYVALLAKNKQSPPPSVLIGEEQKINKEGLAKALQKLVEQLPDPKTRGANKAHGLSVVSIRHAIGRSMRQIDTDQMADDADDSSVHEPMGTPE